MPSNYSLSITQVSVFGVILIRIHSECRKIRTRITPNTGTFYTVSNMNIRGKTSRLNSLI